MTKISTNINEVDKELINYLGEENLCILLNIDKLTQISKRSRRHLLEACHNLYYAYKDEEKVRAEMSIMIEAPGFQNYTLAQYIAYDDNGINLLVKKMDLILNKQEEDIVHLG